MITAWFEAHGEAERPVNVRDQYEHLVEEHSDPGSTNSVVRYVRSHYPRPKIRTYRRVETPPGAQMSRGFEFSSFVGFGSASNRAVPVPGRRGVLGSKGSAVPVRSSRPVFSHPYEAPWPLSVVLDEFFCNLLNQIIIIIVNHSKSQVG